MLEQQQERLVSALQEMYRRARKGESWPGQKLAETNGAPLTHDILAGLGLLESKNDGSGEIETFEEDFEKMQSKLIAGGAGYVHRRSSFSSDSDHSHHGKSTTPRHGTPTLSQKQPVFNSNFSFSPSPSQSPVPQQRRSHPPAQSSLLHRATPILAEQQSPMTTTPSDPQLFQPEWTAIPFAEPQTLMRSSFAMRTPKLEHGLDYVNNMFASNTQWDDMTGTFDGSMNMEFSQQYIGQYGMQDFGTMGSAMDLDSDFKQFIQVST